jgi:hypothetical protein
LRTERGRERNFTDDDINWDYLNKLKKQLDEEEKREKKIQPPNTPTNPYISQIKNETEMQ